MKVAIIYNRDSRNVINLFGVPNRERYGLKAIRRITDALKQGGHQAAAFEGDKDIVDRLQEFMPRALKGERPGMAFNLSYGIQGQARYTHVPSILEMVGIPYVGSGPLAHSLALDKVVAKVLFRQAGLPTPDWFVLDRPDADLPDEDYPVIVKPRSEAVSFGIRVAHGPQELREAAGAIFEEFHQDVLVEQYIAGREINVGLIGNGEPEAFPPAELKFGEEGPQIYTEDDKKGRSGRQVQVVCPAALDPELAVRAQEVARGAFRALGCYDCARVDLRLDTEGNPYLLEINSLPSLGEHGSYTQAAQAAGLDFPALINRLVEVASERYFGTPTPPALDPSQRTPAQQAFVHLSKNRDRLEKRVQTLVGYSARTADPIAINALASEVDSQMRELGLTRRANFTDAQSVWLWETDAGMEGGTLLLAHLDVPLETEAPGQPYRRDPEWIYGEGVASTAAPIATVEFALRSLRPKRLKERPIGVLLYADEGSDCRYSREAITRASALCQRVLSLRPAGEPGHLVTQRRGQRRLRLRVESSPRRPGPRAKGRDPLLWFCERYRELTALSSTRQRTTLAAVDVRTRQMPQLLAHRVDATFLLSHPDQATGDRLKEEVREVLKRSSGPHWSLEQVADRPPLVERKKTAGLAQQMETVASEWDIPLTFDSSSWPSAAGLVAPRVPVVCGLGPAGRAVNTVDEAVNRVSLVQGTLLLAELLVALG